MFRGIGFFFEGGTHTNAGETTAGWNAIARSLFGVCYVVFGPVITVEANVAYAGASQHTNHSAKLLGIIESLRFLSSIGLVPLGSQGIDFFCDSSTLLMLVLGQCSRGRVPAWE